MAKELAWKASKVLKPRGFESHALRQVRKEPLMHCKSMRLAVFLLLVFWYENRLILPIFPHQMWELMWEFLFRCAYCLLDFSRY